MNSAMHWFTTAFDGIVSFLPSLVAGLVILVVGWAIASLLSRLTRAVLGRVGYDPFLAKLGLVDEEKTASHAGSRWTGKVVYVLVMLAAFMQAARAWDVQMLSDGIAGILLYVPHLLGAVFIFGASLYFGNWVRDRIARSKAAQERTSQRPLVGSTVRAGILALGAFMALREMQIAPEIVTIAFTVTGGHCPCGRAGLRPGEPQRSGPGDPGLVRASAWTQRCTRQRPALATCASASPHAVTGARRTACGHRDGGDCATGARRARARIGLGLARPSWSASTEPLAGLGARLAVAQTMVDGAWHNGARSPGTLPVA